MHPHGQRPYERVFTFRARAHTRTRTRTHAHARARTHARRQRHRQAPPGGPARADLAPCSGGAPPLRLRGGGRPSPPALSRVPGPPHMVPCDGPTPASDSERARRRREGASAGGAGPARKCARAGELQGSVCPWARPHSGRCSFGARTAVGPAGPGRLKRLEICADSDALQPPHLHGWRRAGRFPFAARAWAAWAAA
jgi:hypothetical protein